jgi:hypothetical protein
MLGFNPFLYTIPVVTVFNPLTRSQTLFGNAFLDAPRRMFIKFPCLGTKNNISI